MTKVRMRDIVILLPGITGSVLQKDGKDIWAISGQAVWKVLTSLGSTFQQLMLGDEDPEIADVEDGIQASRLIPDAHLVPGLVKVDGYSALSHLIRGHFEVICGNITDVRPANFFEFPYDWCRDNRVTARLLKQFIDQRLALWRTYSGAASAKVIL